MAEAKVSKRFRIIPEAKMGGFGSGRSGWRPVAEQYRSLDVNRLHRAGCLEPGHYGGWQWTRDGEKVADTRLSAKEGLLTLIYRVRIHQGDWHDVTEPVALTYAPCRYGGERPYFLCPGIVNGRWCGRRVAKLYGVGRYFLCRHCNRLTYASRNEDRLDRLHRRVRKLQWAMNGDAGSDPDFPRRPKGMWRRTYERKLDVIVEAEVEADRVFEVEMARRFPGLSFDDLFR